MQRLVEGLAAGLGRFVEQRRDLALLCACADSDVAVVLKVLRDLEQANDTDLFLLFADAFEGEGAFVELALERLRAEQCHADEYLASRGQPALAPLPEDLWDPARPAAARLRGAMVHARALLPAGRGHRVVWAMLPAQVVDAAGYRRLLAGLLPSGEEVAPWMPGMRLVLRAPPGGDSAAWAAADPGPRTRRLAVDFSPAAAEAALAEEVEDEGLGLERRMQALLSLAVMDGGYRRTDAAARKYDLLLGHYQQTGDAGMQAFVLGALGGLYQQGGDLAQARHYFECAVPLAPRAATPETEPAGPVAGAAPPGGEAPLDPAAEEALALGEARQQAQAARVQAPLVLLTAVRGLAEVTYAQGEFATAERCFDGVDQLASRLLDPESKARAMIWRARSRERLGRLAEAGAGWEEAAGLCRAVPMPHLLRESLSLLDELYGRLGRPGEQGRVRRELGQLGEVG